MFKRIDHVEITPTDVGRSLDFYTSILGFTLKNRVPVNVHPLREVYYLTLGDTTLELLDVDSPAPADANPWKAGYRMMALEVEDMDAALAYLAGKGIVPSWGPVTMGPTTRAEIRDPDGLPVELRKW